MDHIASFHQHHHTLARSQLPVFHEYLSGCFEDEALYELEGGGYCPVQPLPHDHGIMHHGTACIIGSGEPEWNGTLAQLRLERGCALLTWTNTAHLPHPLHGMCKHRAVTCSAKPHQKTSSSPNFIDLQCVKDMRVGGALVDQREIAELVSCARRYGLQCSKSPYNMISVKNKSTSELKSSPKSYGSNHTSYSATMSQYHPCAPRHSSLTAAATSIMAGSPNRSSLRRLETSERFWENLKHLRTGSLAVPRNRSPLLGAEKSRSSPELYRTRALFRTGLLTRNGSLDLEPPTDKSSRKKAFDLLAAAALPGANPDVSGRVMSLPTLGKFCETRQHEPKTEQQLRDIIQ
ncbi:Endonuclease-reverse transcriptase HmRTE-e01, partial [Operophtera brumata]